ncbi:MAG TPA: polyphosphate kinase 2 family protein [Candidatus Melainabacteria bacterium]|nr:polyphosphate kinase 2 family protein [Candidatus Melainabacteria bacterium]
MKKSDEQKLLKKILVPPGKKISLNKDYDPSYRPASLNKVNASQMLTDGIAELAELQDKLYAQDTYGLLIIIQAMDAAGKDGTIKHVMSGVNPQGCQVTSFKPPSDEELDHDYLWRCSKALPERGRIGIFNRSYYEEVLVARVHPELIVRQKLPPTTNTKSLWTLLAPSALLVSEQINNFEKYLVENGIIVLKIFLHVSKEEQLKRFLERIDKPEKNWKFAMSDVSEREHWKQYIQAYDEALSATSTTWAPWHVVPADYKPFTRLVVAHLVGDTLRGLNLAYPTVDKVRKLKLQEARKILEAEDVN